MLFCISIININISTSTRAFWTFDKAINLSKRHRRSLENPKAIKDLCTVLRRIRKWDPRTDRSGKEDSAIEFSWSFWFQVAACSSRTDTSFLGRASHWPILTLLAKVTTSDCIEIAAPCPVNALSILQIDFVSDLDKDTGDRLTFEVLIKTIASPPPVQLRHWILLLHSSTYWNLISNFNFLQYF